MSVDAPTSVSADMGARPAGLVSPHREAGMPTPMVGMLLFIGVLPAFIPVPGVGGAIGGDVCIRSRIAPPEMVHQRRVQTPRS